MTKQIELSLPRGLFSSTVSVLAHRYRRQFAGSFKHRPGPAGPGENRRNRPRHSRSLARHYDRVAR